MEFIQPYGLSLKTYTLDLLPKSNGSKGELSEHFNVRQGVRQGAVLSPFLYKTYINPCLKELKQNRLGLFIGGTYCGCPTCADDLALLSTKDS